MTGEPAMKIPEGFTPAAWMYECKNAGDVWVSTEQERILEDSWTETPLYAAPPTDHAAALAEALDMATKHLIARLEAATGPDRELDEAICDHLFDRSHFAQLKDAPLGTGCQMWWQDGHQQSALRYTGSMDAAVTLVSEDDLTRVLDDVLAAMVWNPHLTKKDIPRLTVIAALKARENDDG